MEPSVAQLSESLIDEIVAAVGLPVTRLTHNFFWRLFRRVTDRLAHFGISFDTITKEKGLPAASKWALTQFCDGLHMHGAEHIPDAGPLLILSNHPGTYDALALFSQLKGHEIRCVANVIPFLERLPNVRRHFLFTPRYDVRERMVVLRKAVRHLQEDGTLLFFASGHRDPDPAVYPGAEHIFDSWLNVFDAFFKHVKNLRVQPTIVSGVISPDWVKHPITWLRKQQIDKQRLAEFGQVISQLIRPGKLLLTPQISIGQHFSVQDLNGFLLHGNYFNAIIARARLLFEESNAYFGDFFPSSKLK